MPRAFSDAERARIRSRLIAAARHHFARFGYRKANVGEIARDAGIAKGSLYLFFESKVDLFLAVALKVEREMRDRLLAELRQPFPSPRERIHHFLRFQFQALTEHPFLSMMTDPDEASSLMRDLPEGAIDELRTSDDRFFGEIVENWQRSREIQPLDPRLFGALARAIFAMSLQRHLIGPAVFPDVVELLIDALSQRLAPKENER